jgi:hypothetical protein
MKRLLVFIPLVLFFSTLFAQQKPRVLPFDNYRTETYSFAFGEDSLRHTIMGISDTILTESFGFNGNTSVKTWKKDSAYFYYQFGQLAAKKYFVYNADKTKILDSLVAFFEDGTVKGAEIIRDSVTKTLYYDENGKLEKKRILTKIPSLNYSITEVNDQKTRAYRFVKQAIGKDSVNINFDTTFYPQNRIKTIEHRIEPVGKIGKTNFFNLDEIRYLRGDFYDEKGQLLRSIMPDSLRFFSFKDNVNCYYGFKNRRGDTLIQPRFDNVAKIEDDYFICEEGENKILMGIDGKILTKEKIQAINPITDIHYRDNYYSPEDYASFLSRMQNGSKLFTYRTNNKYGILDSAGRSVLPPQYDDEIQRYSSLCSVFTAQHYVGWTVTKEIVIDSATGEIIGKGRYPYVQLLNSKDFFVYSDSSVASMKRRIGILNKQGEIVLPQNYVQINHFAKDMFWVSEAPKNEEVDYHRLANVRTGLFDARIKRWVLEPLFRAPQYDGYPIKNNILYNSKTRRSGLLDSAGSWILPPVYDTIMQLDKGPFGITENNQFIVSEKGQFYIYDTQKRKRISQSYSFLTSFQCFNIAQMNNAFVYYKNYDQHVYFAKKQGKWGIIDGKEALILPFEYDYAGFDGGNIKFPSLVKNEKISVFIQEWFPKPISANYLSKIPNLPSTFPLFDTASFFMINKKGDVVVPPQYKIVSTYFSNTSRNSDMYFPISVIENKKGKRKMVFTRDGRIVDFPFSKPLLWVDTACPLVLLGKWGDNLGISVANLKTGQIIQHIKAGGLAIGDAQNGTYFVKTNVPPLPHKDSIPSVYTDTLAIDDNGWRMHNVQGQSISKDTFRLPITFCEGIGLGLVGDKYGLWKSDGTTIAPPQYEYAFWDYKSGTFALFQNIGINNWLVLFDKNGKKLVNTGRYDGISDFYGKYALVKKDGKLGLVDTLGNEIVPLTEIVKATNINFRDSLSLIHTSAGDCKGCDTISKAGQTYVINRNQRLFALNIFNRQPNAVKNHPDSLQLSGEMRSIVWNRLIEKMVMPKMYTAAITRVQKPTIFKTYLAYYHDSRYEGQFPTEWLYDIYVDSQRFAFSMLKDTTDRAVYYNFQKKNNQWIPLSTYDLFDLKPDNIIGLNQLLIQKITQLKDKDIDCGTYSSFWERSDHHYLVKKEGLVFYFTTKSFQKNKYRNSYQYNLDQVFVPVEISWAELKPYLKSQ